MTYLHGRDEARVPIVHMLGEMPFLQPFVQRLQSLSLPTKQFLLIPYRSIVDCKGAIVSVPFLILDEKVKREPYET